MHLLKAERELHVRKGKEMADNYFYSKITTLVNIVLIAWSQT